MFSPEYQQAAAPEEYSVLFLDVMEFSFWWEKKSSSEA